MSLVLLVVAVVSAVILYDQDQALGVLTLLVVDGGYQRLNPYC